MRRRGPASLACAGYPALEGCEVTLYEKREMPGGLNVTGVAPYKMNAESAMTEVEFIRSLGVTIKTGVEIGRDIAPAKLVDDHDAVFVGVGLGRTSKLGIPGEDGAGVFGGVEWVEKMKPRERATARGVRRAVVIGGGNTAIDVVRELAKLGVPDVAMLYRRTEADMPGYRHEMELARKGRRAARREGRAEAVRPRGRQARGGGARRRREVAMRPGGRRDRPGKLGAFVSSFPGVATTDKGLALGDPMSGTTGNPKVWVGGDVTGGELVVTAVQDGKRGGADCRGALAALRHDSPMQAGNPIERGATRRNETGGTSRVPPVAV